MAIPPNWKPLKLYEDGSEAQIHSNVRAHMMKAQQDLPKGIFKVLRGSVPHAWAYAYDKVLRESIRRSKDAAEATGLLQAALSKEDLKTTFPRVHQRLGQADDEFELSPPQPELIPSVTRDIADIFYSTVQFQELLPQHQTLLKAAMENVIVTPKLIYDERAADKLPSRLYSKGLDHGCKADDDVWTRVVHLCLDAPPGKLLSPVVLLTIHRPELVLTVDSIKEFKEFVEKMATKFRTGILAWLQSDPPIPDIARALALADPLAPEPLLAKVLTESLQHEVQHWRAGVALNLMKSEMHYLRPSYDPQNTNTMGTRTLIERLSKKESLRVILGYHDQLKAMEQDEKERKDQRDAMMEQQKAKRERDQSGHEHSSKKKK